MMQLQRHRSLLISTLFATLFVFLLLFPIYAQEGDRIAEKFLNNVVQLAVTFSDESTEHGFGFVVGERGEMLYIVTANHVVRSIYADVATDQIQVRFYTDKGSAYPAELLDLAYRNLDLALLKLPKPFESYTWEPKYFYPDPKRGDRVWFIGRNDKWWVPTDNEAGVIQDAPFMGELPVSIGSVLPGTSGAPLFTEEGIVGMITDDSPEQVIVLDIGIIRQVVEERWGYPWELEEFRALPILKPTIMPSPTVPPSPTVTSTPLPPATPTSAPQAMPTKASILSGKTISFAQYKEGDFVPELGTGNVITKAPQGLALTSASKSPTTVTFQGFHMSDAVELHVNINLAAPFNNEIILWDDEQKIVAVKFFEQIVSIGGLHQIVLVPGKGWVKKTIGRITFGSDTKDANKANWQSGTDTNDLKIIISDNVARVFVNDQFFGLHEVSFNAVNKVTITGIKKHKDYLYSLSITH